MEHAMFYSAIQVRRVRVAECSLWTNQEPPAAQMASETSIELTDPFIRTDSITGESTSDMALTVTICYSDKNQAKAPRARFSVRVVGTVAAPPNLALSDHKARAAALAQLYPQAQSYIAMLAALSGTNGVTIPTADIEELANALENARTTTVY